MITDQKTPMSTKNPALKKSLSRLSDEEFNASLVVTLQELKRRVTSKQRAMGLQNRARRIANTMTLKDAVQSLLKRYGRLTLEQLADRTVSELNYATESTGQNWCRSVYQSGVAPLVKDEIVAKDGDHYVLVRRTRKHSERATP